METLEKALESAIALLLYEFHCFIPGNLDDFDIFTPFHIAQNAQFLLSKPNGNNDICAFKVANPHHFDIFLQCGHVDRVKLLRKHSPALSFGAVANNERIVCYIFYHFLLSLPFLFELTCIIV